LTLWLVAEAAAEILGAPDLHIKSGSTLRLVCTLRQSTEPPVFVFWYHEDRMINYDMERGVEVQDDRSSSVLIVAEAQKRDSGNYTCVPSNARSASINVHVLNGKHSNGTRIFIHPSCTVRSACPSTSQISDTIRRIYIKFGICSAH
jgi:hypothetical protein